MTAQTIDFGIRTVSRRLVSNHHVGSSSVPTSKCVAQRGDLSSGPVTLEAPTRLIVHLNGAATATVTLNAGLGSEAVASGVAVSGVLVLPGPCCVVLANNSENTASGKVVGYFASCA